jgi:hypothetical protein
VEGQYRHSAQEELTPACMREVKRSVFAFPIVGVLPECAVH